MVDFTKIKTKYVHHKLKETDDKDYIETLMKIEQFIEKNPHQMFGCMHFASMKKTYKEEYMEILKELDEPEFIRKSELADWKMKILEAERNLEKLKEERERKESELTWNLMKEK
ncbi:MAG: hypothetical protein AB7V77_04830 [Candidatus Woesearchaeota archaeon]